jgi:hypothetical protein
MLDRSAMQSWGSAAARAARHRQRRRTGLRIIPIEVDEFITLNALLDRGILTETEALDRKAVARAPEKIVAAWVSKNLFDDGG